MNEIERILMECRYLLSLNKNYGDLAKVFNISVDMVKDDLDNKLFYIDQKLYERTQKVLKR